MKVDELDIPNRAKEIIKDDGIEELYPPQAEGADDVLSGKNCLFTLPTASGKSLLSYLSIIKKVVEQGGKALYIVPLKALASEKMEDLKHFQELGISVTVSMGDYDNVDPDLKKHDVIVATSEKADSLLRHNVDWLRQINCIVADEVHLVDDLNRGATVEVTISKLKQKNPDAQIVALSATVNNSKDVAEWLNAVHHKSTWRPVELKKAVNYKDIIEYENGNTKDINYKSSEVSLCMPTVKKGKQCIVFVKSRRSTKAVARKLKNKVKNELTEKEKVKLENKAEELHSEAKTELGKTLARYIKDGVAFHHAGLNSKQRSIIEDAFRARLIKVIGATPTLAAGINMPARRVVVRDAKRYDSNAGYNKLIPVMEVQQMLGRAGRPGYDDEGEAILVAKQEDDLDKYMDTYIKGDPENIESKLSNLSSLRTHLLALIATEHCRTEDEIYNFIEKTFHAVTGDLNMIKGDTIRSLEMLTEEDLIVREQGKYKATRFGKRVSDLYIDPMSAISMRNALQKDKDASELGFLHAMCHTPDMYKLYLKKSEKERYEQEIYVKEDELLLDPPQAKGEFEEYLESYKTANLLYDWINEKNEDDITDKYGIGPGDIYSKTSTAEWLINAMKEIARIFDTPHKKKIYNLMSRITYGTKKELLPLTEMRGVGRVRARALYKAGYKEPSKVKNTRPKKLRKIPHLGSKMAKKLSNIKPKKKTKNNTKTNNRTPKSSTNNTNTQTFLSDFGNE